MDMSGNNVHGEHVYCAGEMLALWSCGVYLAESEAWKADRRAWLQARRDHYVWWSDLESPSDRRWEKDGWIKLTESEYWAGQWPMEIGMYVGCTPDPSGYPFGDMHRTEAKAMHRGWPWGCAWGGVGGEKEIVYEGRQ